MSLRPCYVGKELERQAAAATLPHGFVPWILVDGVPLGESLSRSSLTSVHMQKDMAVPAAAQHRSMSFSSPAFDHFGAGRACICSLAVIHRAASESRHKTMKRNKAVDSAATVLRAWTKLHASTAATVLLLMTTCSTGSDCGNLVTYICTAYQGRKPPICYKTPEFLPCPGAPITRQLASLA
jgi:hypothetical protein